MEERFVNFARSYFSGGIEAWDYFVSWQTSAPTYYPESWFWYNHHEAVLALTYEDMNCASAGDFDKTATALLYGTGEFIGVLHGPNTVTSRSTVPDAYLLSQNYPNPFNSTTVVSYSVPPLAGRDLVSNSVRDGQLPVASEVRLAVFDLLGREVTTLVNGQQEPGNYAVGFHATGSASGVYLYRLIAGEYVETRKMILLR
jgi:hypothetical protein